MAKRILVTRPKAQSKPLIDAIAARGDIAVELPLLAIEPISDVPALNNSAENQQRLANIKTQIAKLAEFQHVIFISTNAAELACYWIDQFWPQLPVGQRWYAIGAATFAVLQRHYPDSSALVNNSAAMNSEALLALAELRDVDDDKVLICRGVGGRDYLREQLQSKGAVVEYCELYSRQAVEHEADVFAGICRDGLDYLTASSGETIQKLLEQAMISNIEQQVKKIAIIVPGARVASLAKQLGFEQVIQAENASVAAMLEAIT
jgi:uroporphyrinogen-III synthase